MYNYNLSISHAFVSFDGKDKPNRRQETELLNHQCHMSRPVTCIVQQVQLRSNAVLPLKVFPIRGASISP